jgi:glycerol kinase
VSSASDVSAIGITNQRETVVVWERETGKPIHNAIVWQDRRTASYLRQAQASGSREDVHAPRPGFAARSLFFRYQAVVDAGQCERDTNTRGARGTLCFGTIDTFLIWRLTGGKSFVTDATNASRTLMFNIETQEWDAELLKIASGSS